MNKIRHDIYSALVLLVMILSLVICYFVYDSSYADLEWEQEEGEVEVVATLRPLPQWDEVLEDTPEEENTVDLSTDGDEENTEEGIAQNEEELLGKRIIIDPGHGGKDRGSKGVTRRIYESKVDRSAAMILYEMFAGDEELLAAGFYPYILRTEDVFIEDKDRIFEAGKGGSVYISLHCASTSSGRKSDMSGAVIKYKAADKDGSYELAEKIVSSLKNCDISVRGPVVGDDEYILRNNTCPAILVEMGYLTNDEDCKKLSSDKYLEDLMKAIFVEVKNESLTGNGEQGQSEGNS